MTSEIPISEPPALKVPCIEIMARDKAMHPATAAPNKQEPSVYNHSQHSQSRLGSLFGATLGGRHSLNYLTTSLKNFCGYHHSPILQI